MYETQKKTMVMLANKIWQLENAARYCCPICNYKTHNKTLYRRHLDSTRHFLMTTFAYQAPRDVKMLVASFLPFDRIYLLEQLAVDALNYDAPDWMPWRFSLLTTADLPFRTGVVRVHLSHKKQILTYEPLP